MREKRRKNMCVEYVRVISTRTSIVKVEHAVIPKDECLY